MTYYYVPGTEETDLKKVIMSLQNLASVVATLQDSIGGLSGSPATTSAYGLVKLATQTDMEAATDTSLVPSISVVQYHPGVAKARAAVANSGSASLLEGYNIASVNRTGTGTVVVTLTTAMSSSDYEAIAMSTLSPTVQCSAIPSSSSVITVQTRRVDTGADIDSGFSLVVFGDQ